MGFEMPQTGNEIREVRIRGEEGNSPQQESHKEQPQSQAEDLNVVEINVNQATGVAVSNEQRMKVMNECPRSKPIQDANEETHGQGAPTSHNLKDGSTRGRNGKNVESTANNNPGSNVHNTANNNSSIHQTSEYRSDNSQNQPHPNMQQYTNTTPYTVQSQN